MKSAVENGADAIYFGLERWNARERAENFTLAGLPATMAELHRRGVKGYVTFNTLIYESELEKAEEMLRGIARAGADAVIVQDLGIAKLSRAVAPGLAVHASTQMTVTDAASAEVARSLGIERAILARELSTKEIAELARGTKLELEVFVHGALCVSYSGQCFTSASWGGRSANRGECAQACRLPYDLVVDGERRELGDVKYLLSPLDLAGHDALPELVRAGVVSFKIEGRLKGPEYVAATVSLYRRALDRALAGKKELLARDERLELEQVYSRGGSSGFLAGTDHQAILEGTFPAHRGVRLGTVRAIEPARNGVVVALDEPAREGDGIIFLAPSLDPEDENRPAGRVSEVHSAGGTGALLVFERLALDVRRVPVGAFVWRNGDPALAAKLRATFEGAPHRRSPVALRVSGKPGAPLVVSARDDLGHEASVATEEKIEVADRSPIDRALAEDKLGRLGGSPFELGSLELALEGPCRVPVSALNRVRRELVARLEAARSAPPERPLAAEPLAPRLASEPVAATDQALLVVPLCRTDAHLEGAIAAGVTEVALDWMELVGLAKAVERARSSGLSIVLAPPRIQKPGDERHLDAVLALRPDAVLVRSLGQLELLAKRSSRPRLRGDFSLNAANAIASRVLLERGLDTIVPAYDLSTRELDRLLEHLPPSRVELVVHQHLPMFHMEYCAYARLLSPALGFKGTSYLDCGRPCEKHQVSLRDSREGKEHPVVVDVGCRNTVFSAEANSVADDIPRFVEKGVRRFRVELLREDAKQAEALIRGYREVVEGKRSGSEVRARVGAVRRLGVLRVEG
jgi:putative protease